jgi:hypothetical protein
MSHRVTVKTEVKDKAIAIKALKANGWSYTDEGQSLRITSGPMSRVTLDLRTGTFTGDTDWHGESTLKGLLQSYSEQEFRRDVLRQGHTIQSREVAKNGDVILYCHMA